MMEVLTALQQSALSTWLRESQSTWALPMVLTLHTLGLGVLVGAAFAFDLRVLGMGQAIPLAPLKTLFRVMWVGFWINAATGALLFASDAVRRGTSLTFLTKMVLVAAGVATIILLKRRVYGRDGASVDRISGAARLLAVTSIVVWCAAISAGRLLAYVSEF